MCGCYGRYCQEVLKNLRSYSFFGSTKLWVFPILAWTLLVSVSLFWNLYSLRQNTLKTFTGEAQALGGVALSTVMWTAQHERVHVPLTEWIPPEPFFSHLPDREIVTPEGERFTQMFHALISRQVAEQAVLHGWDEKAIRLTSLQPLNPVNIPVEWEKAALQRLKAGQTENFALIGEGLKAQYTYMMPLRATGMETSWVDYQ